MTASPDGRVYAVGPIHIFPANFSDQGSTIARPARTPTPNPLPSAQVKPDASRILRSGGEICVTRKLDKFALTAYRTGHTQETGTTVFVQAECEERVNGNLAQR